LKKTSTKNKKKEKTIRKKEKNPYMETLIRKREEKILLPTFLSWAY